MLDFSFVPLRPFFHAALAKRWKVQFRQGFAYFNNNVDSNRHIIIRTAILYIYIYMRKFHWQTHLFLKIITSNEKITKCPACATSVQQGYAICRYL